MSEPQKWDWEVSNGNATAEETAAAYTALTTGGQTKAFTAAVWNDILAKISEQRKAWQGKAWDETVLSFEDSKLSADRNMTAKRFNSAVLNIWPIETWPWEETLGRNNIQKGDRCIGAYFLYLTDGLNRWILDLTPLFIELNLQSSLDITPAVQLFFAIPFHIDLKEIFKMSYDMGLYSVLKTLIALSIKDNTKVSLNVMGACVFNILLSVKAAIQTHVKANAAIMLRVINFIQSKAKADASCKTAIPFEIINNIIHSTKGTVLTGDLAYTAVNLDFISAMKASMGIPETLFLNAGMQSILDGSCNMENPECLRFAFDLGGLLHSSARLDLPRALQTGIDLQSVYKTALRAYECWAEYISRIELHLESAFNFSAFTALADYFALKLKSVFSASVTGLLAKIDYLSGDFSIIHTLNASTVLCKPIYTAYTLNTDTEISINVIGGKVAYVSTDLQSSAKVSAGIVLMPVATIKADLNIETDITVYVRFANEELVLASEIDDVLVSALDEQTVKDVEIYLT